MIRVTISTASQRQHGQHCGGSEMLLYLHTVKFACRLYVFRPRIRTPSPEPLAVGRAWYCPVPFSQCDHEGCLVVTVWVA